MKFVHIYPILNFTRDQLLKSLSSGTHVICDRYAYSGVAYTASKTEFSYSKHLTTRYIDALKNFSLPPLPFNFSPSLSLNTTEKFHILLQHDAGLPNPDLIILLEMIPKLALQV
jgi:thymidylate kinase